MHALISGIAGAMLLTVLHLFYSITLFVIARKTATPGSWLAFVPGLNLFLLSRVAGFPAWTGLMIFVPYVGPFVAIALALGVAYTIRRPIWTALLQVHPYTAWILPLYYALARRVGVGPQRPSEPLGPAERFLFTVLPASMREPALFSAAAAVASVVCIGYLALRPERPADPKTPLTAAMFRTFREFPFEGVEKGVPRPYEVRSWPLPASVPDMKLANHIFPEGVNLTAYGGFGVVVSGASYFAKRELVLVHVLDTGSAEAQAYSPRCILAPLGCEPRS